MSEKPENTNARRLLGQFVLLWFGLSIISFSALWQRLENFSFDLLTTLAAPGVAPEDFVIVGIDEPSFAELDRQWPWPRSWHARLVRQLSDHGARVIAMDVLFAEPSAIVEDGQLADAISAAGNVVLAKDVALIESAQFSQSMAIEPIPEFLQAGAATGFVGIPLDDDLVVRRAPDDPSSFSRIIAGLSGTSADAAQIPSGPDTLIHYYGPSHTFPFVSYYQALAPKEFLPDGFFRDKFVLVGLDLQTSPDPEQRMTDQFGTPFLSAQYKLMSGVEIHATLLANAIDSEHVKVLPWPVRLGLLALVIALGTYGLRSWSPFRSVCLVLLLICGVFAAALVSFVTVDTLWPWIAPVAGLCTLYLSQGVFSYFEERRRKQAIKRSFGYYVSPHVVEQVTENPDLLALGGSRRELTIMFTDLAGFTSLAEDHTPEQVTEFLNVYLTEQTRIIHQYGGTVDKFIGDAIMAFWGAPLDCPDHAVQACLAAREMQQSMISLRADYVARSWPELHMRAGLNTGMVTVGNMGSFDRFDYTVIGDDVNLASRLEGVNKLYGTDILMSGATAERVHDIPLRYVDRIRVKGKHTAVDIYTIAPEGFPDVIQERAMQSYLRADWVASLQAWQQLSDICPGDTIAEVYMKRLQSFINEGVPGGWDGIVSLKKL